MPTLLRTPQTFLNETINPMDSASVRSYFQDWGEEELLQERRFWQSNASRKDLIDFDTRRTKIRYRYDPRNMTYTRQLQGQRRSRRVPYHSIKLDVNRFANNICMSQRQIAQLLISEQISAQEWYNGTVRTMKYSFRAVADIARGRTSQMSIAEEREFNRIAEEEISRFNLYAEQVAGGRVPLDGRILNAVCSLGKRLNRIFENWRLFQARQQGFVQARRRLTVAEHCRDTEHRHGCVELARRGWRPIWDITPIGGATCWDGCLCEMEYR